ncbi:hypothetical protein Q9966_013627 [Columba livia]|nr:hypothetical protein Q9966_013627 [Columba livia]
MLRMTPPTKKKIPICFILFPSAIPAAAAAALGAVRAEAAGDAGGGGRDLGCVCFPPTWHTGIWGGPWTPLCSPPAMLRISLLSDAPPWAGATVGPPPNLWDPSQSVGPPPAVNTAWKRLPPPPSQVGPGQQKLGDTHRGLWELGFGGDLGVPPRIWGSRLGLNNRVQFLSPPLPPGHILGVGVAAPISALSCPFSAGFMGGDTPNTPRDTPAPPRVSPLLLTTHHPDRPGRGRGGGPYLRPQLRLVWVFSVVSSQSVSRGGGAGGVTLSVCPSVRPSHRRMSAAASPEPLPEPPGPRFGGGSAQDPPGDPPGDLRARNELRGDVGVTEQRKRVTMILQSPSFREELESLIQEQMTKGNNSSHVWALRQIADFMATTSPATLPTSPLGLVAVTPINDLHGAEGPALARGERLMRCKVGALHRLLDLYGWAQLGHAAVTLRVSKEQEHFLVAPQGLACSEVTAASLVKVNVLGAVVEPGSTGFSPDTRSFGLHAAIYAARPRRPLHHPPAHAGHGCRVGHALRAAAHLPPRAAAGRHRLLRFPRGGGG